MWLACPTVLDEPVTILGLEPEDYGLVMLTLIVAATFLSAIPAFGSGLGVALACLHLKRGQPPGALIHWLHAWELLPIPGVLRPTLPRCSPWS